ncbi:MAG: hypothetical protein KKD86_15540, partial [Bacteroidetes bacterium]|nr:hypothetical protein [Bacteroidota bacterium]MBU1680237.1 hypothetical protein [Bacteroidota bacterium]
MLIFLKMFTRIVLLLIVAASYVTAQTGSRLYVVGNGEIFEGELITKSVRDVNGEVCAGLVIVSDLTGFSYDSNNGIVK